MKMKPPKFGPIFLACGIFIISFIVFMFYVNGYLKKITQVDSLAAALDLQKYDGVFIEKKALSSQKFLFIFDSSNLFNTNSKYHPSNIFKGKTEFTPYLVGQYGVHYIHHALKIAALGDSIRNQKAVFLIEPLYFLSKEERFDITQTCSPLHAYEFVLNSKIDPSLKAEIAKSILKMGGIYRDPVLTILLKNIAHKHHMNKIEERLIKPISHFILDVLKLADQFNVYELINKYKYIQCQSNHQDPLDWQTLLNEAELDGKNACRTNSFGIVDSKYVANIKPRLNYYRNHSKDINNLNLDELHEFRILLCLCKELRLKPFFVIQPVNGPWSDYMGLSKKVRNQCYFQIKQMLQKEGLNYVDFSKYEYAKYFLYDTKHLGWKGWVYVDQAMERFYYQGME